MLLRVLEAFVKNFNFTTKIQIQPQAKQFFCTIFFHTFVHFGRLRFVTRCSVTSLYKLPTNILRSSFRQMHVVTLFHAIRSHLNLILLIKWNYEVEVWNSIFVHDVNNPAYRFKWMEQTTIAVMNLTIHTHTSYEKAAENLRMRWSCGGNLVQ